MIKNLLTILIVAIMGVGLAVLGGCETEAQTGALIGSGVGAGVGALAGGDTEGTLIGAAVGGGIGYILGNEADKKKTNVSQAPTSQSGTETVWVSNSNGSKTPVKLKRDGSGYIGPKGERYSTRPTEEQLRQAYGF